MSDGYSSGFLVHPKKKEEEEEEKKKNGEGERKTPGRAPWTRSSCQTGVRRAREGDVCEVEVEVGGWNDDERRMREGLTGILDVQSIPVLMAQGRLFI